MEDFIHLHVHTYYSILDGQSPVQKLVDKAVANGMRGMAITDHGNMFGVKELFKDPEVQALYKKYSDIGMYEEQQQLARKKDVVSRWFGEWDEENGAAWQSAIIGKTTPADALKKSAAAWNDMRKA